MARILRDEIRRADLNPVRGREQAALRPVLILSQDVFTERSGTVITGTDFATPDVLCYGTLTGSGPQPRLPKVILTWESL